MDIAELHRVAMRVAREEGLLALAVRTSRCVRDVLSSTFCVRHVYICRFEMADVDFWEPLFVPLGFTTFFVASHSDADLLAARGYEDFRDCFLRARGSLDTGAVALCAFSGESLAHVGWVACSHSQKGRFDNVPYPVDFESGEACLGSVFTFPEYRGQGLAPHSMRLRLEYLRSLGCSTTFAAVETDNIASLRAMARVGPFTWRALLQIKLPGINWVRFESGGDEVTVSPSPLGCSIGPND